MPTVSARWDPQAERALYRKGVEACQRFFADRKRPDAPNRGCFDLCLAEYAAAKHLSGMDCFGSGEALISALRELLVKPVEPPVPPCRADRYLACQKEHIV
jgi:hypothetical protein